MPDTRRTPPVTLLVIILGAESLLMVGLSVYLMVEFVLDAPDFIGTALFLTALCILAAGWLAILTVGVFHGRSWTRGGALVWQFLQLAVGIGSIQGFVPRPDIASWLVLPAVVAIVLLLMPSVSLFLARDDARGRDDLDDDRPRE